MSLSKFSLLLYGYKMTQCLYVVAKLNIADHLVNSKRSIDELAKLTKVKADPLYRVMRTLAALDVFIEEKGKYFSLNPMSYWLVSDYDQTLKDFVILCGEELYQSAGQLLYSVQNDLPSFKEIYGQSHMEYISKHPEKAKVFNNAMAKGSEDMIQAIVNYELFQKPNQNIVDLGGGIGHILCGVLQKNATSKGIVFDLKHAKAQSNQHIRECGLHNRCQFLEGSFFEKVPNNADVYLLKVVLHNWSDSDVNKILEHCREAMHPKSRLVIIERLASSDSKSATYLTDINMLVTTTGRERTIDEFSTILNQNGLEIKHHDNLTSTLHIIDAVIT